MLVGKRLEMTHIIDVHRFRSKLGAEVVRAVLYIQRTGNGTGIASGRRIRRFVVMLVRHDTVEIDRLDGLRRSRLGHNHDRGAITVRHVKRQTDKLCQLLHRGGRQHRHAKSAVAERFCQHIVIALRRLDAGLRRAFPRHIHDHHGEFAVCRGGKRLVHQRQSRAGGNRKRSCARDGSADDHVDCAKLAVCLKKGAAALRHFPRQIVQNLRMW